MGFVKIPEREKVSLMCDECGLVWPDPRCIAVDNATSRLELVQWANLEEIQASGFGELVSRGYASSE